MRAVREINRLTNSESLEVPIIKALRLLARILSW